MFTLSPDGTVEPAGVDVDVAAAWMPAVRSLADAVLPVLEALNVKLDGDAYITASANEACDVTHEPHFDDDMFVADDGMGLVAIVGQVDGTRIATGTLPMTAPASDASTQLPLDPALQQSFDDDQLPAQQVDADRIVLFPGFLQLHSGPKLAADTEQPRLLLVLRAQTVPNPI